ncbi:unnamed protein product [Caenorhabditis auriculariae]|uniref:Uncharacterized protein n=1 Tax=Caenorhabditis auriculariae TaxID=2777116 RepID=A0A8S1HLH0_9PELO|nr:unnamed protein product [Caenorhabditis auriculariae]
MISKFASDLPIHLASRWEILAALLGLKQISDPSLFEILLNELKACSSDQSCSVNCSTFVIALASLENSSICAKVIYSCLCSAESATRNNVSRAWIGRMISIPSCKEAIEKLIEMARNDFLAPLQPYWPLSFRQLQDLTCVDLEWKEKFEEDPSTGQDLALLTYLTIFEALSSGGSQIRIPLEENDRMIRIALDYHDEEIREKAVNLCKKYRIFSSSIEQNAGEIGEKNRLNLMKKMETETVDDNDLKLETLLDARKSVDNLLSIQSSSIYPSVAEVMETLKKKNIDERAMVLKMTKIIDFIRERVANNCDNVIDHAELLLEIMSRCPLRAVVDYSGVVVKELGSGSEVFKETIFHSARDLLNKKETNARSLVFELCFIGTAANNPKWSASLWASVKKVSDVKRQTMFEMFSKVVAHSSIVLETEDLCDILFTSLGLDQNIDYVCPKLNVSALSKMIELSKESDRVCLFSFREKKLDIFQLLEDLVNKLSEQTEPSEKVVHLAMVLFSKFQIAANDFYTSEQLRIIEKVKEYLLKTVEKWNWHKFILSAAVDAICGFSLWPDLRWFLVPEVRIG